MNKDQQYHTASTSYWLYNPNYSGFKEYCLQGCKHCVLSYQRFRGIRCLHFHVIQVTHSTFRVEDKFFYPEYRGTTCHWSVSKHLPDYMASRPRRHCSPQLTFVLTDSIQDSVRAFPRDVGKLAPWESSKGIWTELKCWPHILHSLKFYGFPFSDSVMDINITDVMRTDRLLSC
jgi:hypothetical protein